MANLIVRNVDEALVGALKRRATPHGRSVEAERRAILARALRGPRTRSLVEALAAMPDVGRDADFARTSPRCA